MKGKRRLSSSLLCLGLVSVGSESKLPAWFVFRIFCCFLIFSAFQELQIFSVSGKSWFLAFYSFFSQTFQYFPDSEITFSVTFINLIGTVLNKLNLSHFPENSFFCKDNFKHKIRGT